MDANYVFLCGLMWYRGQEDAGCELVRAIKSADPDLRSAGPGCYGVAPRQRYRRHVRAQICRSLWIRAAFSSRAALVGTLRCPSLLKATGQGKNAFEHRAIASIATDLPFF